MQEDDTGQDLRDLSAIRTADRGVDESASALEDAFLGDDLDKVGAPTYRAVVQKSQPCNKATMVCLRGPCVHHWAMTTRFGADDGTQVRIRRHRVCTRHAYETELQDVNVYVCEGWKPAQLAWVPDSIWIPLQPYVRALWERWLARQGYNFEWRWFPLDIFEWDAPERRRFSGPGGGHLYDEWKAKQEGKTGYGAEVPEEKA